MIDKMSNDKDLLREYKILYKAYMKLREELNFMKGIKESSE